MDHAANIGSRYISGPKHTFEKENLAVPFWNEEIIVVQTIIKQFFLLSTFSRFSQFFTL